MLFNYLIRVGTLLTSMVALSEEFAAGLEGIDANLSATSVFDVSPLYSPGKYQYHLLPLLVALVALAVHLHSAFR